MQDNNYHLFIIILIALNSTALNCGCSNFFNYLHPKPDLNVRHRLKFTPIYRKQDFHLWPRNIHNSTLDRSRSRTAFCARPLVSISPYIIRLWLLHEPLNDQLVGFCTIHIHRCSANRRHFNAARPPMPCQAQLCIISH